MKNKPFALLALALFLTAASTASAHPLHVSIDGFASGFTHPLSGWDHLLAMIAIGIWAAQLGGLACWRVPVVFVTVMTGAAAAGHSFGVVPGIDQGVAASVLGLGLLIGTAKQLPLVTGVVLAAIFAVFHGLAHGAEMPATVGGLQYGIGFIAASLALHAIGLGLGLLTLRVSDRAIQLAGWGVAAAGVAVLAS